ncbi:MAG: carbohydrate ABC transporter permease [Chloroflexota bacterium]|nr:MAG: carbohydrate ABC transporter permease [Chloroflexota bacterium]
MEVAGRYAIYLIIVVFFLMPFIWMFFGSVRRESEIHGYMFPFSWNTIVPVEWTLQNFLDIYGISEAGEKGGLKFHRGLMNSGIIAVAVVCLSLLFNTMAAYFFARLPFPRKNYLLAFVIATFLLPFEVTVVPLYLVISDLQLRNTYWAMIVPFYASPFIVFMLSQFLGSIPKELDEAATVDGANYWQILWSVIVPNALPAIATAALIEFQFIWNLFYWPLIATSSLDLQVIQVMIASQTTDRTIYWGRTFAGLVSAVLPVLLLFLFGQRFYFRGAVLSGMK